MPARFSDVQGQDSAVSFLERALDSGQTTHAYLLAGGDARTRSSLALDFAAQLIASDNAGQAGLVVRKSHPDLHVYVPDSARGFTIGLVRTLIHDTELSPVRAATKVYLIEQADRLTAESANAFLKTLEEPPQDTVFLLLAETEHQVLETIRSRCEVLVLNEGQQEAPYSQDALELMPLLAAGCSNTELLEFAQRVVESAKSSTVDLEEQQAAELEQAEEYLSAGARNDLEKSQQRALKMARNSAYSQFTATCRAWLRDCLLVCEGTLTKRSYPQMERSVGACAAQAGERGIIAAIEATRRGDRRISYNVTPQLAIEAMCIEIREALCR
ncbi:MAG: ATP-binding protein [Coriobacteriales bacterium]